MGLSTKESGRNGSSEVHDDQHILMFMQRTYADFLSETDLPQVSVWHSNFPQWNSEHEPFDHEPTRKALDAFYDRIGAVPLDKGLEASFADHLIQPTPKEEIRDNKQITTKIRGRRIIPGTNIILTESVELLPTAQPAIIDGKPGYQMSHNVQIKVNNLLAQRIPKAQTRSAK